jgi:hypothetical protein
VIQESESFVLILELFDADGAIHERLERLIRVGEATRISDSSGPLCQVTIRRALILPGGKTRSEMAN